MSARICSRETRPTRSPGTKSAGANSIGGFRRTPVARENNRAGRSARFFSGENGFRVHCEATFPATGNAPLCSGTLFSLQKDKLRLFASIPAIRIEALFGSRAFLATRRNHPLRSGSFRAFTSNTRLRSGRIREARMNRRGDSGSPLCCAINGRAGSGVAFSGAGVGTLTCC